MPACGYEFYLLVFNSTSRVEYSKIKFISTRDHVISSLYKMLKTVIVIIVRNSPPWLTV